MQGREYAIEFLVRFVKVLESGEIDAIDGEIAEIYLAIAMLKANCPTGEWRDNLPLAVERLETEIESMDEMDEIEPMEGLREGIRIIQNTNMAYELETANILTKGW